MKIRYISYYIFKNSSEKMTVKRKESLDINLLKKKELALGGMAQSFEITIEAAKFPLVTSGYVDVFKSKSLKFRLGDVSGLLKETVHLPSEEMRLPQSSAVCHAKKKNPKNRTTMASTGWSVILA